MLLNPDNTIRINTNLVQIISMATRVNLPKHHLHINVAQFMADDFERFLTGLEPFVQNTLYNLHNDFIINLSNTILNMSIESGLVIVISSTRGYKRAVAAAELLAREIRTQTGSREDIKISVYHKELSKWLRF